ncbi:MAG: nuclear transport factor 2 family protein [Cyanothece sp. SIO1E1]|nr:nuclear transport factor 2 family protein [Cyanothece sp. SIO1E1]
MEQRIPSIQRRGWQPLASLLLGLTLCLGVKFTAQAAPPDTAPTELSDLLANIEAAANSHDIRRLMQFYSQDFVNSDGLDYQATEKVLTALWDQYPQLAYRTDLKSWEMDGNTLIAETVTRITGHQALEDRELSLNATIESRQRVEDGRIIKQEILSEESQLTSGISPPNVEVSLPEKVTIGRDFNFDAIVQEPLGNQLLLGAAVETPVSESQYFTLNPIAFDLLSAGGIFKIGQAPAIPDTRWVSAVVIREDGITTVTKRLETVGRINQSSR